VQHPNIGLAYAYCNYKHEHETAVNIMGSLLQQLLHSKEILPTRLANIFKMHNKGITRPRLDEVKECLIEVSGMFSEVFIIVDALDEYDEGDGVRDVLGGELLWLASLPQSHVMVTSRWLNSIKSLFPDCIRIEIRASDQDVTRYLEKRMDASVRLQRLLKDHATLKTEIINTLVDTSQGMSVP
jgi:hypothetical protein